MKEYTFEPQGVCAKAINFSIDDEGKLRNVKFFGGCPGNLQAISKLVDGADPKHIAEVFKGNDCGNRGTSCADQFSIAIENALKETA